MQEDLLGYLLGALEPNEMRRVEHWLREDAQARRELAELERVLKRMEERDEVGDEEQAEADLIPPPDLVSRTLANLPPLPPVSETESFSGRNFLDESLDQEQFTDGDTDSPFGTASLSRSDETGGSASWNLRDGVASFAAVVILLAITLPALSEGRFAARKAACQDHLRELGVAMAQFATRNAQSRLPSVAPDGYQAFAGVYAPRLREAGLLDNPQLTFCPSMDRNAIWPISLQTADGSHRSSAWTPTPDRPLRVTLQTLDDIGRELTLASEASLSDPAASQRMRRAIEKLRWIQLTAGGQYSYTLGVRDGEKFSSPRFQGRSHFALMSDAAITRVNFSPNGSPRSDTSVISHRGRGINVLYEDGHVVFLPSESLDRLPDNPLVNHEGLTEAGVTIDDASLAPSWQPPFIRANQR